MVIFGLCSTSDDQLSDPSNESHQKMKCSFFDYVQLLIIGRVIRVTKVNQNAKKAP